MMKELRKDRICTDTSLTLADCSFGAVYEQSCCSHNVGVHPVSGKKEIDFSPHEQLGLFVFLK